MMAKDFKTGEVVQLKSGGPKMTVSSYAADGERVYCQWFSGSKLESGSFPVESVERVVVGTAASTKK